MITGCKTIMCEVLGVMGADLFDAFLNKVFHFLNKL